MWSICMPDNSVNFDFDSSLLLPSVDCDIIQSSIHVHFLHSFDSKRWRKEGQKIPNPTIHSEINGWDGATAYLAVWIGTAQDVCPITPRPGHAALPGLPCQQGRREAPLEGAAQQHPGITGTLIQRLLGGVVPSTASAARLMASPWCSPYCSCDIVGRAHNSCGQESFRTKTVAGLSESWFMKQ